MSLVLVLAAWALVLLIPAIAKMRNHRMMTSVSRFHDQLIVLGRTSTTSFGISETQQTTQTYLWAHSSTSRVRQTRPTSMHDFNGGNLSPTAPYRSRQQALRQRRSMVLFSLLVLVLITALVATMAFSAFAVLLFASSLSAMSLYTVLLVRLKNSELDRIRSKRLVNANASTSADHRTLTKSSKENTLRPGASRSGSRAHTFEVAGAN